MSKLVEHRDKLNLTQEELSKKSGISVRTIQRIESGIEPKGYTLKALAKSLNIKESELNAIKNDISENLKPISKRYNSLKIPKIPIIKTFTNKKM